MQRTVWTPEGDQLQSTRVARLMARLGHPIDDSDPAPSIAAFIRWSQRQPDLFWGGVMDDLGVVWSQRYEKVRDLSGGPEWTDWFVGGRTSIALNTVDIPATECPDRLALIAETEDGDVRRWTFGEAAREIDRLAWALTSLGIGRGDSVACYMPMVAEVVFAMLATMKMDDLGVVWSQRYEKVRDLSGGPEWT
ncbi:MAG TPA: hypothetical protein EYN79_07990, partial [Planctomycetes bacterium]|nr:hypothetical protein [Planctomycetota bacterium]